jgi:hypothetical protein
MGGSYSVWGREFINAYRISIRKPKDRDHLGDLNLDGHNIIMDFYKHRM